MAKKQKLYVAVADSEEEDAFLVNKFEDGDTEPTESFKVDSTGFCGCPGYRFRKTCRHTAFLASIQDPDGGVTLDDTAVAEAEAKLKACLSGVVEAMWFIHERDPASGEVLKLVAYAEAHEDLDEPVTYRLALDGCPVEVTIS